MYMSYICYVMCAFVRHTTCGNAENTMRTERYMCSRHVFVHVSDLDVLRFPPISIIRCALTG